MRSSGYGYITNMVTTKQEKRFALLMAARDSDYVKTTYGGYYNVFVDAYGDQGERWDLFRVIDGEFPCSADICMYDAFVISGSPNDAYGDEPWVMELCELLQKLDSMRKKLLGICFGHQVLCHALGGKVGKAETGWDIGVREVTVVDEVPCGLRGESKVSMLCTHHPILEIHQDEVWEVPEEGEVVAYSEKTGVEVFAIQDRVLGIQGHPEYSKDILCNIIDRLVGNHTIDKDFAEETKLVLDKVEPDAKFWIHVCKKFLKNN